MIAYCITDTHYKLAVGLKFICIGWESTTFFFILDFLTQTKLKRILDTKYSFANGAKDLKFIFIFSEINSHFVKMQTASPSIGIVNVWLLNYNVIFKITKAVYSVLVTGFETTICKSLRDRYTCFIVAAQKVILRWCD